MNKESPFSEEYAISGATTSKPSIERQTATPKDKETTELISKIESDYELSKPRRNIIRARIIS